MSPVSKSFEFGDGSRNSKQLLYKDQLYNKHLSVYENKMSYNAEEISLQDYLYAQSSNIDYYEFQDVDTENLETDNELMLHSLALANLSQEIH